MDESALREYILRTCPSTTVVDADGDSYFFTDPEQKHPFATLVTSDAHAQASDLGRPGVFRLNVGVSKATFQSLFGAASEAQRDFTALDVLMPHPVYGKMYWVCPEPWASDVGGRAGIARRGIRGGYMAAGQASRPSPTQLSHA